MSNDAAKWLAGSIPVAVAVLTVAGVSGSDMGRVARIYDREYVVGVLALVVAVVLGVTALFSRHSRWLLTAGVLAFAVGTALLVSLHAAATSKQDRPTVSTTLIAAKGRTVAKIGVSAAGLRPSQYVFVAVQGQNSQRRLDDESAEVSSDRTPIPPGEYSKQRIYSGRIGASPDGKVETSFEVPLASGLYEQVVVQAAILSGPARTRENAMMLGDPITRGFVCGPETSDISCITVLLPTPPQPFATQPD